MSQGYCLPAIRYRAFTANGAVAAGYKLYAFISGTITPQNTYTDGTLSTPNANPVVLDANGEAEIFLPPDLVYTFKLKDASDAQQWSVDGVVATTSPTAGAAGTTVPTGNISMYGGASAPAGYLLCDGSAVSRGTFAALFAVVASTFGAGDGVTTFNLPDLRQRFPMGKAASGTGNVLGATGGAVDHTHTGPSHTHTVTVTRDGWGKTLNAPSADGRLNTGAAAGAGQFSSSYQPTADLTVTSGADGTEATGTANPPFQTVNFIIKT
jgi:microcystin-dependent protein